MDNTGNNTRGLFNSSLFGGNGGVLGGVTERYNTQKSEFDKNKILAEFEEIIESSVETAIHEESVLAVKAGRSAGTGRDRTTNNFNDDKESKFFKEKLTDLLTDVHGMTKDQLYVQKSRMAQLSKNLENSNAVEKEELTKLAKKTNEFIEEEFNRKNAYTTRIGSAVDEMAENYIDFASLYAGFFNNNPIAMLGLKFGKQLWTDRKQRKKDEAELLLKDELKRNVAIQTAEFEAKNSRIKMKREMEIDLERDKYEKEKRKNESTIVRTSSSSGLNENSGSGNIDNKIDSIVEQLNQTEEGSVAEEIHQDVEEKSDRKKQQAYYQDTRKWQKNLLKCICPNGKTNLGVGSGSNVGTGTSGSGTNASSLIDNASIAGMSGAGALIATKAKAIKDGAIDALKKHKKVGAVLAGGMLYLGLDDDVEAKGIPKIPPSISKDIDDQVSKDSLKAVTTDVALSSLTMLKAVKAIPGVGSALGGVGDAGLEYAQGGSAGSSIVAGAGGVGGGVAGAVIGASIGSVVPVVGTIIGGLIGAVMGGLAGSSVTTSLFGDSESEKQANLISRQIDNLGIIDRNDLLPNEDSKVLEPARLNELSGNQLQSLLALDDFSEEDTELIQKALDNKQNNKNSLLSRNNSNSLGGAPASSMLDKIGKAESNNNYDAEWGGGKFGNRDKQLTDMTMAEVKAYQKEMINTQKGMGKDKTQRSSALGRFQFISSSMKEAQEMSGLSDDDLFSKENQDKMGEMWLKKRGGMDDFMNSNKSSKDADKFQNAVASQWASMKTTSGRGAYDNDGMNTARHSIRGEVNQLMGDSTSNADMVQKIESTNNEIKKDRDDKQNQPQVIQQISSNSTGGSGGGGNIGSSTVGSARNNNSSLQRITDRYISSGMS